MNRRIACCLGLALSAGCGLSTATTTTGASPESVASQRVVVPESITDLEYDAVGNLTRLERPGASTTLVYDALDRPTRSTDALGGQTSLLYRADDAVVGVVDPRAVPTTYERDGFGGVTRLSSNDTGLSTKAYDEAGNLSSSTDARGVTTLYTYDALDRLTRITHRSASGADEVFDFTFDDGRLVATAFPAGSATFAYDLHGALVEHAQQVAQVSTTTRYGYTGDGHLASLRYPSGRRVDIAWDAGLPTGLSLTVDGVTTALVSDIGVDALGQIERWAWQLDAGPRVQVRASDSQGRLVSYPLDETTRLVRYDEAGRIAEFAHVDDAGATATDESFTYDALDRLVGYTSGGASHELGLDATGNRISLDAATWQLVPTSNRLASLSYDEAGNLLGDGQFVATYDGAGRLSSLTKGGVTTTYAYDGRGRRVRKHDGTVELTFVYDPTGQLLGEYDAAGAPVREYVWLGGLLLGFFLGSDFLFVQVDHLGAPRVAVDLGGHVRWRHLAHPFGDGVSDANLYDLPLRFPGQYADAESGFFDNHHRTYDPATGRYLQPDPIGLAGGINSYAYVDGNPLAFVDPDGLAKLIMFGAGDTFGPGEIGLTRAANADPDYPNLLTVYAHGGPEGISDRRSGREVILNAEQAAKLIRDSGQWKPGMPVLFRSCEVGKGGKGHFIWQLARELGVPVTGATELVYAVKQPDGSTLWEPFDGWSRWRPWNDGFGRRGTWITASPVSSWVRSSTRSASAP